jgi:hypothetical protein
VGHPHISDYEDVTHVLWQELTISEEYTATVFSTVTFVNYQIIWRHTQDDLIFIYNYITYQTRRGSLHVVKPALPRE